MGDWKRTHTCGELNVNDVGSVVTLMGWIQTARDHGGVIFADLRDREGVTQVVFNPEIHEESHKRAHVIRSEYVVAIKGLVRRRPEGMANPNLATGEIEVVADELRILNSAKTPPFPIEDKAQVSETVRLKYRYLDLRSSTMMYNLTMRHKAAKAVRDYLDAQGFIDVETPFLTKSTPEGARDYLVPSRLNPGFFYALPQSPQLFKQILMVAGFDRYYQIVRCFRDEDLRADRQPEFTQIDMEMSFVNEEGIFEVIEGLMVSLFKGLMGVEIGTPFRRLAYQEAMERFGTDKPDLRFGMELSDVSQILKESTFKVFSDALKEGGVVKTIRVKRGAGTSRKELDDLTQFVGQFGAKGLAWIKVADGRFQSPIAKFLSDSEVKALKEVLALDDGDLALFVADESGIACKSLGELRLLMGERLNLIKRDVFEFVWITNFPLLEYDSAEGRYVAVHHPFTAPMEEDIEILKTAPEKARARSYDLVLNGVEIGGGSVRNHRRDVQSMMFEALNIREEEAKRRFGFLLEALEFGAPPHGGIAFGFDRLLAVILKKESIREVIAFPKTQKAMCLLTDAPSDVDQRQLDELSLKVRTIKRE
jgi:aspartyl-tRNA synthetase